MSRAMYNEVQNLISRQQKAEREAVLNKMAVGTISEVIKEVIHQEAVVIAEDEMK